MSNGQPKPDLLALAELNKKLADLQRRRTRSRRLVNEAKAALASLNAEFEAKFQSGLEDEDYWRQANVRQGRANDYLQEQMACLARLTLAIGPIQDALLRVEDRKSKSLQLDLSEYEKAKAFEAGLDADTYVQGRNAGATLDEIIEGGNMATFADYIDGRQVGASHTELVEAFWAGIHVREYAFIRKEGRAHSDILKSNADALRPVVDTPEDLAEMVELAKQDVAKKEAALEQMRMEIENADIQAVLHGFDPGWYDDEFFAARDELDLARDALAALVAKSAALTL